MRIISIVVFCTLSFAVPALAQEPKPTARYAQLDVAGGYAYLSFPVPDHGRVNMHGVDGTATLNFLPRIGAIVDLSYVRTGNIPGTPQNGSVFTGLGGIVAYPWERRDSKVFVRVMAGASRVEAAVPVNSNDFIKGYLGRFSYAAGAGYEFGVTRSVGLRFGADYLHTEFFDSTQTIRGQNNLRVIAQFVFHRHGSRR